MTHSSFTWPLQDDQA